MSEPSNTEIMEMLGEVLVRFDSFDKKFAGIDQRFDGLDDRFSRLETELRDFKEETRENFHEVKASIREVQGMAIPLNEQSESLRRINRIEKHLNLPHELEAA